MEALRHFLQLDPASFHEFLFSIGYIALGIILFIAGMNWSAIKKFLVRLYDIALAIAEAYCEYEEAFQKLSPEERSYLQQDINLFI